MLKVKARQLMMRFKDHASSQNSYLTQDDDMAFGEIGNFMKEDMQILEEEDEDLEMAAEKGLAIIRTDFENHIEKTNLALTTRF